MRGRIIIWRGRGVEFFATMDTESIQRQRHAKGSFRAASLRDAFRLFLIDGACVRSCLRGGSRNCFHWAQFLQSLTPLGIVIGEWLIGSRTAFGPLNRVVILRALDADE